MFATGRVVSGLQGALMNPWPCKGPLALQGALGSCSEPLALARSLWFLLGALDFGKGPWFTAKGPLLLQGALSSCKRPSAQRWTCILVIFSVQNLVLFKSSVLVDGLERSVCLQHWCSVLATELLLEIFYCFVHLFGLCLMSLCALSCCVLLSLASRINFELIWELILLHLIFATLKFWDFWGWIISFDCVKKWKCFNFRMHVIKKKFGQLVKLAKIWCIRKLCVLLC